MRHRRRRSVAARAADPVAPGRLRGVERLVGAAQQAFGVLAAPSVAQPTLTVTRPSPATHARPPAHALRGRRGRSSPVSGSSARNSSPPRRPRWSSARRRAAQRVGDGGQHPVAGRVAVLVVERLEVVEVDDRDETGGRGGGRRDQRVELAEQEAPVGEPGQRVLEEQRLEPPALVDELLLQAPSCARRRARGERARARATARPGCPAAPCRSAVAAPPERERRARPRAPPPCGRRRGRP